MYTWVRIHLFINIHLNTRTDVCTQEWTLIGELRSGLAAASCLDRVDRSREEVLWRPALTSGTYLLTSLLLATRCFQNSSKYGSWKNLGIWVGSDIRTSFTTGKTTIQPMTLVGQAKIATIFLEILIVHFTVHLWFSWSLLFSLELIREAVKKLLFLGIIPNPVDPPHRHF